MAQGEHGGQHRELMERERTTYIFAWKNNPKREQLHGRRCKVLHRGPANSALVEFIDNGQREVISRNALRRDDHEQRDETRR
jgi:hypothetical protein